MLTQTGGSFPACHHLPKLLAQKTPAGVNDILVRLLPFIVVDTAAALHKCVIWMESAVYSGPARSPCSKQHPHKHQCNLHTTRDVDHFGPCVLCIKVIAKLQRGAALYTRSGLRATQPQSEGGAMLMPGLLRMEAQGGWKQPCIQLSLQP